MSIYACAHTYKNIMHTLRHTKTQMFRNVNTDTQIQTQKRCSCVHMRTLTYISIHADLVWINFFTNTYVNIHINAKSHIRTYVHKAEIYIGRQNEPAYEETHEPKQIHKDTNTNSYVHTQMYVHTGLNICTLVICSQT